MAVVPLRAIIEINNYGQKTVIFSVQSKVKVFNRVVGMSVVWVIDGGLE